MSPQLLHSTVTFYDMHSSAINAAIRDIVSLSSVGVVLALLLQVLKRKFVVGDRIVFSFRGHTVDYDYKAFIQIVLGLVSFSVQVANNYLALPAPIQVMIGNTALLFMVTTYIHRFGVSRADAALTGFLNYLSSRKGTDSAGTPSA